MRFQRVAVPIGYSLTRPTSSLIGTSRSYVFAIHHDLHSLTLPHRAHYNVLVDENNFTPDECVWLPVKRRPTNVLLKSTEAFFLALPCIRAGYSVCLGPFYFSSDRCPIAESSRADRTARLLRRSCLWSRQGKRFLPVLVREGIAYPGPIIELRATSLSVLAPVSRKRVPRRLRSKRETPSSTCSSDSSSLCIKSYPSECLLHW